MSDKQIIIDGVKISKKDFIDDFSIELTNRNIFERDQIGDKYFEIIFAKEQEYNKLEEHHYELEEKFLELNTKSYGYILENDQLKAENERLKQFENDANDILKKQLDLFDKKEQALKEIKEIAENGKRFAERWMITGEQRANVLTYANAILQKISECEVIND